MLVIIMLQLVGPPTWAIIYTQRPFIMPQSPDKVKSQTFHFSRGGGRSEGVITPNQRNDVRSMTFFLSSFTG
jgi:hypothetical protein